nr:MULTISPECIES: hypothetical protein [unclassified Streptomyces]
MTEERPPRPPRAGRPWAWALGGAVLASTVWGGGVYAYAQREEPGPDLGGYATDVTLCDAMKLKALGGILGERRESGAGAELAEPSLYQTYCSTSFGPVEAGFDVGVTYTVHKVSDPEPEFEARAKGLDLIVSIGGLGERAFFGGRSGDGGELRVLDGQIEIEMSLSRLYRSDGQGRIVEDKNPVDLSGIEVPMTQDLLALMEELKK